MKGLPPNELTSSPINMTFSIPILVSSINKNNFVGENVRSPTLFSKRIPFINMVEKVIKFNIEF